MGLKSLLDRRQSPLPWLDPMELERAHSTTVSWQIPGFFCNADALALSVGTGAYKAADLADSRRQLWRSARASFLRRFSPIQLGTSSSS